MFSQYCGEVPRQRPSRAAVSALIPPFPFSIRLMRFAGTRIACANPLILIPSSFMSSSRILPGWIGGSFFPPLVVVGDFDIGRSFRFPVEADSILVVDPNAEPALAAAAQRFQSVPAKCPQVLHRGRGVQPDQTRSSLLCNVHQFNHAQALHQPPGPLVFERLNHIYKGITLQIILQGPIAVVPPAWSSTISTRTCISRAGCGLRT